MACFLRTPIFKENFDTGRNLPSSSFPALMTPFPVIAFINEGTTGFINEKVIDGINKVAKVVIITPRNPPSNFFLFHLLLFYLHHQLIDLIFQGNLRF